MIIKNKHQEKRMVMLLRRFGMKCGILPAVTKKSEEEHTMKRTRVIYAVTVFAALSLASQAFAMGGSMGQGNGGGKHGAGGHTQQGGMSGMQNGSGSGAGSRHETMHEAGSQHGSMNASGQQSMMNGGTSAGGSDTQPATPAPATAQPLKN